MKKDEELIVKIEAINEQTMLDKLSAEIAKEVDDELMIEESIMSKLMRNWKEHWLHGQTVNVPDWSKNDLIIECDGYANGGAMAISLVTADGIHMARMTVNIPEYHLHEDEILVKTWSENEPVIHLAFNDPRFIDTGLRVPCGRVFAEVWQLNNPDKMEKTK